MNSMEPLALLPACKRRWMAWPLIFACLAFSCCRPAFSADQYYINNAIVSFPGTVSYPPQIDALNFVNNNQFIINFTVFPLGNEFYQPLDTINYTNTGLMLINSGYQFDTLSSANGVHYRAGTFNNSNSISCGSFINDPGAVLLAGLGQCLVNASNIVNHGSVDVGPDGLIQMAGRNVDLYQGLLNVEGAGGASGIGFFGLNTNFWDPSLNLSATFAFSPVFPIAPGQMALFNSVAYTNMVSPPGNTNLAVTRAVFIEDTSGSNVSVNVYFGAPPNPFIGFGDVTIEWAGSYLDPATGNTVSNYFYLNDDYALGASTNILPVATWPNGVAPNFTFTEFTTPQFTTVAPTPPSGLVNSFAPPAITNLYDVVNVQLTAGPGTNTVANGAITNLPGRVQIAADNELDLTLAQITGPSYMSVRSTNQFDGSAGSLIQTPYADLDLGVTNGYPAPMSISNIMSATLPVWGGNIVAWNTRWLVVTNSFTNDYRVLIVSSQISPTLAAQVQDLTLRDTNSIIISDTFNVMRSFRTTARSLTLTTNDVGNGATSFDGELNLESPNIFFQSSAPNLRYLTNSGAVRMQNLAYFSFPFLTNSTPPVQASAVLTEIGTNVVKKDKVVIGTNQYTFVATLTNTIANQIVIVPTSFDSTMSNLIAAINGYPGAGINYSTVTRPNTFAVAGPLASGAVTVTALGTGSAGNSIPIGFTAATSSINLTWGSSVLGGGVDGTTNIVPFIGNSAFINNGIFMDQGSIIYADNFESSDVFSNGVGSFALQSITTTLTNGFFYAGGDVSITADSMVTSNAYLEADRSLTLQVTNLLTDTGPSPTNNSYWVVASNSIGAGISIPIKPPVGDLLGTTIKLFGPTNRTVVSVWSGTNYGLSTAGYTNNLAVGQLIFDVATPVVPGHFAVMTFNGVGVSNALYVDRLILTNFATTGNATNNFNFPWLKINTNMFIYYADALENGLSVAQAIDDQSKIGANGGRLRWISSYAGFFSSTNLTSTNSSTLAILTNTVNSALVESATIDSDGDGLPNNIDPTPFFQPSAMNFTMSVTNLAQRSVKIQWTTIPNATNFIYYTTNILSTNWLAFTNFKSWYFGNNVAVTNAAHGNSFHSPQVYSANPSLPDNAQQTNVWLYDTVTNVPHYYKIVVWPWLDFVE